MGLKNLFLWLFLCSCTLTFAQQRVTGSVKDSAGKPVVGATVIVLGTTRNATTNSDGGYSIEAVAEEILQFAAQGYQNVQKKVGLETSIEVVLPLATEESKKVGALGVERDANAAGYTDTTLEGGEDLKGKTAGLTSSTSGMGNTKMVLRGPGTVTGSNQPLIVIDGVPMADMGDKYGNAASEINQDDIESVTILTGGAATALYGSRGGNGVILYTTKSGKGGKTNIDVKSSVTFERAYIAPKLQNEYGGGDSYLWSTAQINGRTYKIAQYAVDESWGPKYDGTHYLPWYAFDEKYLPQHYHKTVPWQAPENGLEQFYRTGISTNNALSITRSVSNTNLRFSLGNGETTGIVPTTQMDKSNLSFSFTSDLSSKLKSEGALNYSITKRHNPQYTYYENDIATVFYGYTQRQLDMRKLQEYYQDPEGKQRAWNRYSWSNGTPIYADNPYWVLNKITNDDKTHRFFGNIGLTYNFTPQLYVIGKIYGDIYVLKEENRRANYSLKTPYYSRYDYTTSAFNYEARLHYNPQLPERWKDIFSASGFIGTSRAETRKEWVGGSTQGGLTMPNWFALTNSAEAPYLASSATWTRTNSIYGMVSLGYKSMLFVEATGRNDWFSTVTKPIFYPSVTGSFVFTSALKKLPSWLSYGKLRAGWAQVGNDADAYVLKTYPYVNSNFRNVANYVLDNTKNSENLRPEIKQTQEAGIDLRFLQDRISLSVSVYDIISKDLILDVPVDAANGRTYKKLNSGEMSNRGVEITLSATPVQTDKFAWYLDWNFSRNVNRLNKLYPGLNRYRVTGDNYSNVNLYAIEGRPFGEIYGADIQRDGNGRALVDEFGKYLRTGEKLLGNINPDFTTGLTNTLTYGGFSLSFTFDYQKGGSYFSGNHMLGMASGLIRETVANGMRDIVEREKNGVTVREERGVVLDGVYAPKMTDKNTGLSVDNPRAGQQNTTPITPKEYGALFMQNIASLNVFDASYLKLRSVSLSYDVPLPETKHIKGLNFTLSGYNLWTTALAWDGADPETAAYFQGVTNRVMPTTRSFGLSVGLKL